MNRIKNLISRRSFMKSALAAGCVSLSFGGEAVQNVLSDREKAEGWVLLWDGQTTNGWVGVNTGCKAFPSRGWIIRDGVLTVLPCIFRCDDKKEFVRLPPDCGGDGGDLVTVEKFRDFDFKIDFRLTPRSNSGIKYFYDETKNRGTTLEYQIMHHEHPDQAHGHDGDHRLASLYDLMPAPEAEKVVRPAGEWNTARIVARGRHVEHWLNGVKVLEFDRGSTAFRDAVGRSKYATWGTDGEPWGELVEGRILLQDHKDSTVSYRNIKIRRVPSSVAKTVVGVINWDCSLPSDTWFGHYATTALSPTAFRHATPYYAAVKGPDRIDYRWRTVEEYEREMQYAIDAGTFSPSPGTSLRRAAGSVQPCARMDALTLRGFRRSARSQTSGARRWTTTATGRMPVAPGAFRNSTGVDDGDLVW